MKRREKRTSKEATKDHYTVTLEQLRDDFQAFGEGLGVISHEIQGFKEEVSGQLKAFGEGQETIVNDVKEIHTRLIRVEDDVVEIKHKLSDTIKREEFGKLEKRVIKVERAVLSRKS